MIDRGTWPLQAKLTKSYTGDLAGRGAKTIIEVVVGLCKLDGNAHPYFSLTGSIFVPGQRERGTSGMIHDEILAHWPELAPLAAIHLSDDNGVPMHAEANGRYWLAGALGGAGEQYHGGNNATPEASRTPAECLEIFAKHCRISLEEAALIRDEAAATVPESRWVPWMERVNAMRPRWKVEAEAAKALIESLSAAVPV